MQIPLLRATNIIGQFLKIKYLINIMANKYTKRTRKVRKMRNTRKGGATPRQTPRRKNSPRLASVTHERINFPPSRVQDASFYNTIYSMSIHSPVLRELFEEIRQEQHAPYPTKIDSGHDLHNLLHLVSSDRELISNTPDIWKNPVKLFKILKHFYSKHTHHKFDKFGDLLP